MANNHMYAIDRSDEYLAHYGIKGMKWGVRKALESGNDRALARQYRKASRKLAKLQKQATSGKKYARRAAALGAGAAAAGGLAAAGTQGVGDLVRGAGRAVSAGSVKGGAALSRLGNAMNKAGIRGGGRVSQIGSAMTKHGLQAGSAVSGAGRAVQTWGKQNALGEYTTAVNNRVANLANASNYQQNALRKANAALGNSTNAFERAAARGSQQKWAGRLADTNKQLSSAQRQANVANAATNNNLVRLGAGALGAGLAVGAGYNAYRAATTKKAAKRAAEFQREMNQAFKGTKYANGGNGSSSGNKKRRRR